MSRSFKLYRLQQIDSQLDRMDARIKEIDAALNADGELRTAARNAEQLDKDLQAARKNLQKSEDNVRQQRVKIEQNEATLYGGKVHNPKELQDLQNEVAALKRYLVVLEDQQLEAMLLEEEADGLYKAAINDLEAARVLFNNQSIQLTQEKEKITKDISRFHEEHQAAASAIQPEDLTLYDQLRLKRRGIAVAKVSNRACAACGSTLNASLLDAVHSPNQVSLCETCGRILYIG